MRPNMSRWFLWSAVGRCYGFGWRMVALAVLALVVLAGISCCDKVTKPKEVMYNIYVGATHLYTSPTDSSFHRIYIYDSDSLALLDSLPRSRFVGDLAVSPDGRWLYVVDLPLTLWKIDARSKQVLWSRPGLGGHLRFLKGGELLLCGNDVLKPEDGTVVRHVGDGLRTEAGPMSGTKVAVIIQSTPSGFAGDSIVRVIDVESGEVSGRYVAHLSSGIALQQIYSARLHPDGKRVLAIGVYGSEDNCWFVVGDVETGRTLFGYRIYRPHGEIAISNDGTLAVVTDPEATGGDGIPRLINLRTFEVTVPPPTDTIGGSQVRFLPGDQYLVTAPASIWTLTDNGPVNLIDVNTMHAVKTVWPTGFDPLNWPWVSALAVGPRPQ